MTNSAVRTASYLPIVFAVCGLFSASPLADELTVGIDPGYDRFAFDTIRFEPVTEGTYPIRSKVGVLGVGVPEKEMPSLVRAINSSSFSSNRPRFTTFRYPDWLILDENPVPFTILDWLIDDGDSTGTNQLIAGGFANHSLVVATVPLTPEVQERQFLTLYTLDSSRTRESWNPIMVIREAGDIDDNGRPELFVCTREVDKARFLFCLELEPLELKWRLPVSSLVDYDAIFVLRDSDGAHIAFVTTNPSNGLRDSLFDDRFCYYGLLNAHGQVMTRSVVGCNYEQRALLQKAGGSDQLFMVHSLFPSQPEDCDTVNSNRHYLSQIDRHGQIQETTELQGIPRHMWVDSHRDITGPALYIHFLDKSLAVYDTSLTRVEERMWEPGGRFLGRSTISGHADSVVIFSSGIYDGDLSERLLSFPLYVEYYRAVTFDRLGGMSAIAFGDQKQYIVARIRKKSNLELASVFYHRNQEYVLMLLSGMFVGLVVVNVYRRRTKANLALIAVQKSELEKTHEELKAAQAELIAAEKYKQAKDIAGGFAHEIRNALFPADSLLTKLAMRRKGASSIDDQTAEYHRHIQSAVGRAIDITELIFRYTKLESQFKTEACDIQELIAQAITDNEISVRERQANVSVTSQGVSTAVVDKSLVRMALSNLVANSLDALAGNDDPSIYVAALCRDGALKITITDNGRGIAREHLGRVMDPFFSTKGVHGTGLGLSISKRIVEMHDGTMTIANNETSGATAILTIPQGKKAGQLRD